QRRRMEGAHFLAATRGEGEMDRSGALVASTEPELRPSVAAHPDPVFVLHHHRDTERRQRLRVELLRSFWIIHRETDMVEDHRAASPLFCVLRQLEKGPDQAQVLALGEA